MANEYEKDIDKLSVCAAAHKPQASATKITKAAPEQNNYMRYTTLISDEDSFAYNAVREAEPYGPDKQIEKKE